MGILSSCMSVTHSACLVSDKALELELQTIVNHHLGSGIEPRSSGRGARVLNFWATSLAPLLTGDSVWPATSYSGLDAEWAKLSPAEPKWTLPSVSAFVFLLVWFCLPPTRKVTSTFLVSCPGWPWTHCSQGKPRTFYLPISYSEITGLDIQTLA